MERNNGTHPENGYESFMKLPTFIRTVSRASPLLFTVLSEFDDGEPPGAEWFSLSRRSFYLTSDPVTAELFGDLVIVLISRTLLNVMTAALVSL